MRVNNTLSWGEHIQRTSAKASQSLGLLRRNISSCPQRVKSQAYIAITRPKLEYASAAWSPYTAKDSKRLESVQNAAARFCTGDYRRHSSVSSMVSRLAWGTLRTRRILHDAIIFFKIQHDLLKIPFPPQVSPPPTQHTRRNHTLVKAIPQASINAYKHSFFIRTIPVWNNLSLSAVSAPTVSAFQAEALPTIRSM